MIKPGHLRRLLGLAIILGIAFAALGYRLMVLQVFQHEKYRAIAERKHLFLREPRRGDILDVNGNPLATSVPVKKVFANPRFLGVHYAEVARVLAPLLSYPEAELIQKLKPGVVRTNEHGTPVTNSYVNLHRQVSVEQWQQITQAMARLSFVTDEKRLLPGQRRFYRILRQHGIYAEDDQQRVYTSGHLAAHVLGFVRDEERDFNSMSITEISGQAGMEYWLNKQLRGVRGWRVSETDLKKREIVIYREQEVEPRSGLNAVLTLDMIIQQIVEVELAEVMKKHHPVSASSLVVRPRTGEILAMATLPNYDPNKPTELPEDHFRNRIIADVMEPGSTFKIVVVAAALNEDTVKLTDMIDCENGAFHYQGKVLHDHGHYGVLTVENIISKSSNIGAAKIGIYKLGEQKLYQYIRAFGFGSKTGITLGGEISGLVHPVKNWDRLTVSRIPMGQGIGVTHLQMVMAMCAIANEGRLMQPMLVNRLQEQNGAVFAQYRPQALRQVVSERAAQQTVAALKTVVSREGTAPKAALEHYLVAGKTGTAQKAGDGRYLEGKYVASFIGFFPADAPEICISVVIDEPLNGYYGGQIAAPFFKNIAEQVAKYLKIRPDRDETSGETVAGPVGAAPLDTVSVHKN